MCWKTLVDFNDNPDLPQEIADCDEKEKRRKESSHSHSNTSSEVVLKWMNEGDLRGDMMSPLSVLGGSSHNEDEDPIGHVTVEQAQHSLLSALCEAHEIFDLYIDEKAPNELKLSSPIRIRVRGALDNLVVRAAITHHLSFVGGVDEHNQWITRNNIQVSTSLTIKECNLLEYETRHIFDNVHDIITTQLETTVFARFRASDIFQELLAHVRGLHADGRPRLTPPPNVRHLPGSKSKKLRNGSGDAYKHRHRSNDGIEMNEVNTKHNNNNNVVAPIQHRMIPLSPSSGLHVVPARGFVDRSQVMSDASGLAFDDGRSQVSNSIDNGDHIGDHAKSPDLVSESKGTFGGSNPFSVNLKTNTKDHSSLHSSSSRKQTAIVPRAQPSNVESSRSSSTSGSRNELGFGGTHLKYDDDDHLGQPHSYSRAAPSPATAI
jgi:hypothetical protein